MNLTPEALIGQHYAFAHGRLGVLRQALLTENDMHRLLGTHDEAEFRQIMGELKIAAAIDQPNRDPEVVLASLAAWVRTEAEDMVDTAKHVVFRILWLSDDLPLLAYLLKRHAGMTSTLSAEPVSLAGAYDADALRALVQDGTDGDLPAELAAFVRSVRSDPSQSPEHIDALVARFGAQERIRLARAAGSDLILRYVRHSIDAQNIRTALRLLHANEEHPASFLLDGGTIPSKKLLGSIGEIRTAIAASDVHFHVLTSIGADMVGSPTALERGLSDLLAQDIERMWERTLGIEPPFAFAASALAQLRLIRAVMLGKRNGLPPQEIKHILPPFVGGSRFAA